MIKHEQTNGSYTRRRQYLALIQLETAKLIVDNNLNYYNNHKKVFYFCGYFAWK